MDADFLLLFLPVEGKNALCTERGERARGQSEYRHGVGTASFRGKVADLACPAPRWLQKC